MRKRGASVFPSRNSSLIALFAVDDKHHSRFDELVRRMAPEGLRLLTTWPCVVEAAYLLDFPPCFEMLRWIEMGARWSSRSRRIISQKQWSGCASIRSAGSGKWIWLVRRCTGLQLRRKSRSS